MTMMPAEPIAIRLCAAMTEGQFAERAAFRAQRSSTTLSSSMTCVVRFRPSRDAAPVRSVTVPLGVTLLEAARRAGVPVARACGGDGLCGRCGLRVLAGGDWLAPPGPEEELAKRRNRAARELRLACQVELRGPIEVTAAYW
jgi:ferredoxin